MCVYICVYVYVHVIHVIYTFHNLFYSTHTVLFKIIQLMSYMCLLNVQFITYIGEVVLYSI